MASKEVRDLVRELRRQGFEVVDKGVAHPKIYKGGVFIGILPSTPSDRRALKNKVKELEKHGFKPKG